jgi:hypothetical protein
MGVLPPRNTVAKGPLVHCLDELSKRPDARERLEELQAALLTLRSSDYRRLEEVFEEHLFSHVYDDVQKIRNYRRYLRDYWFDETLATAEFSELQPIAPVYAEGVIKTLDLSLGESPRARPKRIDAWWIVDHPKVEMINLVNENCVTLLIATPRPKLLNPAGIWSERAEAWSTIQGVSGTTETRRHENRPKKEHSERGRIEAREPIAVQNVQFVAQDLGQTSRSAPAHEMSATEKMAALRDQLANLQVQLDEVHRTFAEMMARE